MSYTYEWKPEYSVGSKTLDIQHQKLLMLCKQVSDYQCDSSRGALKPSIRS
jgi:hemerythrin